MSKAKRFDVTLTAYNIRGDEDEFDSWIEFAGEYLEERCGLRVAVDAFRYLSGRESDLIEGADEGEELRIREALAELWEEWCAEGEREPGA